MTFEPESGLSDVWMERLELEAAERGIPVENYFASLVTPESIAAALNRFTQSEQK